MIMEEAEEDQRTNNVLAQIREARNNDAITELVLGAKERGVFTFTSEDAVCVVDCLVDTPRLTTLNFSYASFTDDALDVLHDRLPSCRSVTEVSFLETELGNEGLNHLRPALVRMPIMSLVLERVGIHGTPGGEMIGNMLGEIDTLQELNLAFNESIGTREIGQSMARGSCILYMLHFYKCGIGNDGVANLFLPLRETSNKNKSLLFLSLTYNGIAGVDGGRNARGLLEHFESLQELDLRENPLGPGGCRALGSGLALPDLKLERLELECCGLRLQGVRHLVPQGRTNKSVTSLHLGNNAIEGRDGGEATGEVLSRFLALQELHFGDNLLGPDGVHGLVTGLKGVHLLYLDISRCSLGDDGVQVLSESVATINNLEELNIIDNDIMSEGLDSVTQILGRCKKMKKLHISHNRDIFKGRPAQVRAFAGALSKHEYLREVNMESIDTNEWVQEALLVGINESAVLCNVLSSASGGFIQENLRHLNLTMERNRMLANLDHDALGKEPTRSVVFLDALEEARRHEKGLDVVYQILRNHHKKILPQSSSTTAPATTDTQFPARPAAAAAAAAVADDPPTQTVVEEQLSHLKDAALRLNQSLAESNQHHLDENSRQELNDLISMLQNTIHENILPQSSSTTAPATADTQFPARPAAAAVADDPPTQTVVEEQLSHLKDAALRLNQSLAESNQHHLDENSMQELYDLISMLQNTIHENSMQELNDLISMLQNTPTSGGASEAAATKQQSQPAQEDDDVNDFAAATEQDDKEQSRQEQSQVVPLAAVPERVVAAAAAASAAAQEPEEDHDTDYNISHDDDDNDDDSSSNSSNPKRQGLS